MVLLLLLTDMEENPAGLVMLPMENPVKPESPSVTLTEEVTDTAETIFPSASAGKMYSPGDWLSV
ncbi:hypothetical protein M118_4770 [Bacteroides fragilis str. 3783N1-2]|nr:hypothetical protein M118_4770 [Bacteroides fragilis str. 3783N1-2]